MAKKRARLVQQDFYGCVYELLTIGKVTSSVADKVDNVVDRRAGQLLLPRVDAEDVVYGDDVDTLDAGVCERLGVLKVAWDLRRARWSECTCTWSEGIDPLTYREGGKNGTWDTD